MSPSPANRTPLNPPDAKLLRVLLIYVLPGLAVFYVVLSGLWLVPDSLSGMYGNHDGHWASWSARGILQWSGFLEFSPISPLTGTGSPFLPNLPWLNPGSLALAIPAPLPLQHLASMLVYLAELSASLYLLYRHLEFSREQSFVATILYICIFFIPLNGFTHALPWYALAPTNAHLIAAMNVATIALIRVGYERTAFKLIFGFVFVAALFVAFASAPITSVTYVPVYAALWLAFLIPFRTQRPLMLWRWGTIAVALLVLGLIGVPSYLAGIVMTAARGDTSPPMFHPGWQLLSVAYWQDLISDFPVCANHLQLMCWSSIIGWFEIAALVGAVFLVTACSGAKHRYGLAIIALLVLLHVYALLSMQVILGRLQHAVSSALSHVGLFSSCGPSGTRNGRYYCASAVRAAWRKLGMDAGSDKLPHRVCRSVWMVPVDSAESAASTRTRTAWSCPDRSRAGQGGPDHRLSPAAHRLEAGWRISWLRHDVPWRARRAGPQVDWHSGRTGDL